MTNVNAPANKPLIPSITGNPLVIGSAVAVFFIVLEIGVIL